VKLKVHLQGRKDMGSMGKGEGESREIQYGQRGKLLISEKSANKKLRKKASVEEGSNLLRRRQERKKRGRELRSQPQAGGALRAIGLKRGRTMGIGERGRGFSRENLIFVFLERR